jgi:hypothetical protein
MDGKVKKTGDNKKSSPVDRVANTTKMINILKHNICSAYKRATTLLLTSATS